MKTNIQINSKEFFEVTYPLYTGLNGNHLKQCAREIDHALKEQKEPAVELKYGLYRSFAYFIPAINQYLASEMPFLIAVDTDEHQDWILNVEWPRLVYLLNEHYGLSIPEVLTTVNPMLPPPLYPKNLKSPGIITNFDSLFFYYNQGKLNPGDYSVVCFDNALKLLKAFETHSIKKAHYSEFIDIEEEIRGMGDTAESDYLADLYAYYIRLFSGTKFMNLKTLFPGQFQLNIDEELTEAVEAMNQYLTGLRKFYQRAEQPENIMRLKKLEEITSLVKEGSFTWVDNDSGSSSMLNTVPSNMLRNLGGFLEKTPRGKTIHVGFGGNTASSLFHSGLEFAGFRKDNLQYIDCSEPHKDKVIVYHEPSLKYVSQYCESQHPHYLKERDEKMVEFIFKTGGKTLILFNSYVELEMWALTMEHALRNRNIPFFDYHTCENNAQMLMEFGRAKQSCLLMTFNCWVNNFDREFHVLLNSVYKGEIDKVFIPTLPFPLPDARLYFRLKEWEKHHPGKHPHPRMDYMLQAMKENLFEALNKGWKNHLSIALFDSRSNSKKIWPAIASLPFFKKALFCDNESEFIRYHNLAFNENYN